MTNKEYTKQVKTLLKKINRQKNNNIIVKLDNSMDVGNGKTPFLLNKNSKIYIGNKFNNKPITCYGNLYEIDNYTFTYTIVTIFHELKHVEQQKLLMKNLQNITGKEYATIINYLACFGNQFGYYSYTLSLDNYFNNPREIEAEYYGITAAYNYLSSIYCLEKTENFILEYINTRNKKNEYFIYLHNYFNSITDIDKIFQETLKLSNIKPRYYDKRGVQYDSAIQYAIYLDSNFINKFNQISNPLEQDMILAYMTLHTSSELDSVYPTIKQIHPIIEKQGKLLLKKFLNIDLKS